MLENQDRSRKKSLTIDSYDQISQKKRTRATPDQLAVLEETFNQNTSPNAKMREMLAEKLGMNERSIQIWFQNRRAKVKLLQKRAQQAVNDKAMRQHSMFQNYGYPFNAAQGFPGMAQRSTSIDLSSANAFPMMRNAVVVPQKAPNTIQNGVLQFSCDTLSVGTWRRVALSNEDLLCTITLTDTLIRWQIVESANRFKIEFPMSSIISMSLEPADAGQGQLTVDILQAPQFFMEINNAGVSNWTQCRDFTEGHQATTILQHVLTGPLACLQSELMSLMGSAEQFKHIINIQQPLGGSLNQASPMKRPSLNGISADSMSVNMQRRGSAPASVMFDQNPKFMMRRGSLLDHASPLMETATLESPMASPLGTPLTGVDLSPPSNLMFSPQLNDAFNSLHVLDEFKMDPNSASPNNANTADGISPAGTPQQAPAAAGVPQPPSSTSIQQGTPAPANTPVSGAPNGTAAPGVAGAPAPGPNGEVANNTDFLFDIAQFLDSTSEGMGLQDNLISAN